MKKPHEWLRILPLKVIPRLHFSSGLFLNFQRSVDKGWQKGKVCNLPPSFEMEKAGVGNGDHLLQAMPHFDDLPDDKNLLGGI